MQTFFERLAAAWRRFTCLVRESRRRQRDARLLGAMTPHELRDIGFTDPSTAVAAAAGAPLRCC